VDEDTTHIYLRIKKKALVVKGKCNIDHVQQRKRNGETFLLLGWAAVVVSAQGV
jgi:hypothetical protein